MINGHDLKVEVRNSREKVEFRVSDPLKAASELAHILMNLRRATKRWDEEYGSEAKNKKKAWEKRADDYLESIKKT